MSDRSAYWTKYHKQRKREDPRYVQQRRDIAKAHKAKKKQAKEDAFKAAVKKFMETGEPRFELLEGFQAAADKRAYIRQATAYWRNAE